MFNVLSALSMFAVLLYCTMGIFIYRTNKASKINRLFLLWCLSMAIWSFGYAFVYVTAETQYIWMKVSAFGWCFFGAFALHWVLLFTQKPLIDNKVFKISLYLPGILFCYMSVFMFYTGRTLSDFTVNFFYTGNFIYNFTYNFICILLFILWGVQHKNTPRNVKQSTILVIASVSPFMLNLLTQTILPMWGITIFPYMGHLYSLIMLFGIYYAMMHYSLFNISPQILNDTIFSEMMDLAILVSPEGKITRVSRSTEKLLGYSASDLLDQSIGYIIHDQDVLGDLFEGINHMAVRRYSEVPVLGKTGELLAFSISSHPLVSGKLHELEGMVLLGHDIRLMKQLKKQMEENCITMERLRQSEERFREIFYKNSAIMYLLDTESLKIADVTQGAIEYYGYSREELQKKKITELNGLSESEMLERIHHTSRDGQNIQYYRHLAANKEWRDVEVHITSLLVDSKRMLISIVIDITDRKKAEDQISYLAYHDALTGLANRKYFYEQINTELENAMEEGKKAAIMFLDLDGFKQVNDRYGHETGDLLLTKVSERLRKTLRTTDIIARMGGDEFTLLIKDIADRSTAEVVAQKISDKLSSPFFIEDKPVYIRASIGISIFPDDGGEVSQLLNKADRAMYAAKEEKRKENK